MQHIIALSGGKDSTALALRMRESYPELDFQFVCTPTGNELPEMEAHWFALEGILKQPIIRIMPFGLGDGLMRIIEQEQMIPNYRARFCTRKLKIEPMIKYLKESAPCIHYVGLRADEEARQGIYGDIEGVTHQFPLQDWGWTIHDVWSYLDHQNITIPKRTDCGLCFFQRLDEWKYLLDNHRDRYKDGEAIEHQIGGTFRSPKRDTWPADLTGLRNEFEAGRPLRLSAQAKRAMQENCDRDLFCRVCTL